MKIKSIIHLSMLTLGLSYCQNEVPEVVNIRFKDTNNYQGFLYHGINQYSKFREALLTVKKIEEYIEYHSKNYFSGYYDGQWKILPAASTMKLSPQEDWQKEIRSNSSSRGTHSIFKGDELSSMWNNNGPVSDGAKKQA